jgi:hypothetical protein
MREAILKLGPSTSELDLKGQPMKLSKRTGGHHLSATGLDHSPGFFACDQADLSPGSIVLDD